MRSWAFHPLFLYPILALISVTLVFVSLRPDLALGASRPEDGHIEAGVVELRGGALAHPDIGALQYAYVPHDIFGRATALRVAVATGQPPPDAAETGVRIELGPQAQAAIGSGAVTVDVSIRPVPVTTAEALAISLQGIGPTQWVSKPLTPDPQVLRYELPGVPGGASAIGLRPVSSQPEYAYGVEIVQIRIYPAAAAPAR